MNRKDYHNITNLLSEARCYRAICGGKFRDHCDKIDRIIETGEDGDHIIEEHLNLVREADKHHPYGVYGKVLSKLDYLYTIWRDNIIHCPKPFELAADAAIAEMIIRLDVIEMLPYMSPAAQQAMSSVLQRIMIAANVMHSQCDRIADDWHSPYCDIWCRYFISDIWYVYFIFASQLGVHVHLSY